MQFQTTEIPGLLLIMPRVFQDERGYFLESFNAGAFANAGVARSFVQDNHAHSRQAGVLRGLHFQAPPHAQSKLVWVTRGAVFDVVVDLRAGSPTYGKWKSFLLTAENFARLFIPRGFAHGYATLEPDTDFMYKVDGYYNPASEGGLRWDDPDLAIDWPVVAPVLSDKDRGLPSWRGFQSPFNYENPAKPQEGNHV
ncbi:dTDP-4-dehydrorhamnose 3,5-epimerase [Alkalidesulfovibrio alkalitolerans DSM 16529]|jgi:dTDP-4-dehydrorhamnose 3,5-epimerase|uniref:dTDP-4-dehydrorhamnose 3,5-epimerase n=1 Tax=Alkalidesulfovibrio alkalitolerans DSM 16529 TaxID=1121439 RepID=S7T305_9BACT|nr:dTDP-4-dehydrorhamnose 3,5-epimerase [Alkalidesulfovibrio alkalitolerans]EPR30966.1 dTDP-4-dehydrorhamnose 3,5-epimerase [Alkalidesulfovibrio alkalitolerans DSM 16529]